MDKSKKLTIAFDVNNTLSHSLVRKMFSSLDRKSVHIIVWSTLGADYARRFCQESGLQADEYLDKQARKVDIALDDIPTSITASKLVFGVYQNS